jgi:hypothetical protein
MCGNYLWRVGLPARNKLNEVAYALGQYKPQTNFDKEYGLLLSDYIQSDRPESCVMHICLAPTLYYRTEDVCRIQEFLAGQKSMALRELSRLNITQCKGELRK